MENRRASPVSPPSPTTTATTNGIILGKYKLGRLLGKGSFAKVYHAHPLNPTATLVNYPNQLGSAATTRSSSSVAIKVIEKPKTPELASAMEPRILHEIHAMQRLKPHPNILKIHEVMATKSRIYLVMDLAPCGDLQTKLSRRGRFTEPTARRYFEQLISALHFCHQNGVAHRDIKPQNLLLDHQEKTLKISDFGLSALPDLHRTSSQILLRTACGTPAYAAPEVFRRGGVDGYDGAKADAWSCGVILFLFLSGYLPFDDSNLATMYKKICRREYQFPNWVSGRVRSIISQLLDPNPDTRMTVEALMGHVWFRKSMSLPAHFKIGPVGGSKVGKTTSMNAFDIISMSSGLDLSGFFEKTCCGERERRFTAKGSVEVVEERVEEVGGRLGYSVERDLGKGGRGSGLLLKGRLVLVFEIFVVVTELVMVVVKVVEGGGGVEVEVEGVHWEELRVGRLLGDEPP
ncbi:hypothetical protein RHGRI_012223 [Rhododendron griersonianum]|uniref:non-specific serine/threonine protein kinase n=1 Tax=Rhododendron griersonianum TaxID=479676 RepID=A0AAV6KQQ1_9ERIC|nr:hypothetical protein RHGRI_012223 [Rhododendron griersonianum]